MTDSSGLQHTDAAVKSEGAPGWPAAVAPRRALIQAEACAGLSHAARQALPDTLSENTKLVYRSALQGLNERLAGRCVCDEHLSEVLAGMSAERLSASTLRVAVAAVNKEAELAGLESPCGRSTTTVLRAHARRAPPPQQVTAVDWQAADLASALAAKERRPGLAGLRDAIEVASSTTSGAPNGNRTSGGTGLTSGRPASRRSQRTEPRVDAGRCSPLGTSSWLRCVMRPPPTGPSTAFRADSARTVESQIVRRDSGSERS